MTTNRHEYGRETTGRCHGCKIRFIWSGRPRLKDAYCPDCGDKLKATLTYGKAVPTGENQKKGGVTMGNPTCLCEEDMTILVDNKRYVIWQCQKCGRLLLKPKYADWQRWFIPELDSREQPKEGR